jgi:uncharacterized peroxidase-related enzyme
LRIASVFDNASFGTKLKTRLITLAMGGRENLPEIIPLFMYRPAFFGRSFLSYVQHVLRGPSWWSVGEREVMAAYVSQTNACRFCLESHRAVAEEALAGTPSEGAVAQLLKDPTQGAVRAELKAVLPLVEKLTRAPQDVTDADVDAVRAAGVPEHAIEEAMHVVSIFSTINRVADSLGFSIPPPAAMRKSGKRLLTHGYQT